MIGKPASEFILISAYHDINAWEKYTHLPSLMNEKIVYKENNLLKQIKEYIAQKIPITFGPPPRKPPNLPETKIFVLLVLLEIKPSIVPGNEI